MRHRLLVGLGAAMLLCAAGDPGSPGVIAQRGDVRVTAAEVRDMLSHVDPAQRARIEDNAPALANFVRERLLNRAMLEEAKAGGWDQKPEVAERINQAKNAIVLQSYLASLAPPDPAFPDDATVSAAYEANKARFMVPRQYHLAQIVLLVPPGASTDIQEALRRQAVDLHIQAAKPKADFAELAKKQSQEKTSAEKGGDLGWLREDQLIPVVKDAVAGLPDNGISEPVRAPDGWHVIRVLGIKAASPAPLADVKPQIVQALRQGRAQKAVNDHIEELLREQPIQLNETDLVHQVASTP